CAAGFEQVEGALDVDALVAFGLGQRRAHAGERAEVDDDVEAVRGEQPLDQGGVDEVALAEGVEVARGQLQAALVQRGRGERLVDVVDAEDLVAARAQAVGQVRADEAGDAGQEHLHCCSARSLRRGAPSRLAALASRARKSRASARSLMARRYRWGTWARK